MKSIEKDEPEAPSTGTDVSLAETLGLNFPAPPLSEVAPKDRQIAELQSKLAHSEDRRGEEHYWSILIIVLLLDFLILPGQSWLLHALTILLEASAAIYFAKKMGLEHVAVMMDGIREFISDCLRKRK